MLNPPSLSHHDPQTCLPWEGFFSNQISPKSFLKGPEINWNGTVLIPAVESSAPEDARREIRDLRDTDFWNPARGVYLGWRSGGLHVWSPLRQDVAQRECTVSLQTMFQDPCLTT